MSIRALIFCMSACTQFLKITSLKNGMDVHLKWHLSLFSFRLILLHLCSTFHIVSSWSLPSSSYPTTIMLSTTPNTLGVSLSNLSIFHWNMSPAGAAPNGSCLYLYLSNWHENAVRCNALLSNFRLWYPELASMIDMYLMLLSFGSMSFSMDPLCMGLINAWFTCAGSKHNLTLPLALGTSTKLLHHSDSLSSPIGTIMACCCCLSNSSLNGFCSAYATHLGGTWYSLLSSLSYKENVSSKHPMPLNITLTSLCICCVNSALFLFSVSQFGSESSL